MFKVGLTGGIGSGKTTVSELFKELGIPVIDADEISRDLSENSREVLQEISRIFGKASITHEGKLDRKFIRKKIFEDPGLKLAIERILHPRVYAEINRRIEELNALYCVISIPLLIETGNELAFDRILVIDLPEHIQIERAVRRDDSDPHSIKKIIQSQLPREERLAHADDIITNDGNIRKLREQVMALHRKYVCLAQKN